ncbi:MAG: AcrR family transcriptional regulator [Halobacteriales archaeon]|jgi:AcrR family transcriptional regulator
MTDAETPETTEGAIMHATHRALCKHGYPETSISNIADEFEKSRSLLYYHYDDKESLLEDFLRFLLDRFEAELDEIEDDDPYDHLMTIVDRLLPPEMDDEQVGFRRAILELRSQAPYHEGYHEQLERSDELIVSELIRAIENGIDDGQFRAVNSERVAEYVYSTALGAVERGVTLEDPDVIRQNRAALEDYIESQLRKYG